MTRLGVDTGGTFTDAVTDDGRVVKLPSRPDDPAAAVVLARERLDPAKEATELIHGTTVATNAVLEGKTARVGVLTNRGFRDALLIGRQTRPRLYALEPQRASLPTCAELMGEISGRLLLDGTELEPVDAKEALRVARRLVARGAEALAVVLLHAAVDSRHERAVVEALVGLGVPVSRSSAVDPWFREIERGVTTVVNAGLRGVVESYLLRLSDGLGSCPVLVMTSEGGVVPAADVAAEPVRLLVSGPAGGLVAAQVYGNAAGAKGVVTLDMGGTSTDVALLLGSLPRTPTQTIAGLHVRTPGLDIHTVGAGGGSIAQPDRGGALRVGPESVGADPGPAAYGRGDALSVTDAHLLLGHIPQDLFAGGTRELDLAHAERVARRLARSLHLQPEVLLTGILRLADVRMLRALRVITLERGHDPRGDTLVAFGGAGGLHATGLARAMGLKRVCVPPDAGVLSAKGLLWASPSQTRVRSLLRDHVPGRRERAALARPLVLELKERMTGAGFPSRSLIAIVRLDLRYAGQSFELEVDDGVDPVAAFHQLHDQRYGFRSDSRAVELVGLRVTVTAQREAPVLVPVRGSRKSPEPVARTRPVIGDRALPVFLFDHLLAGQRIEGPALCVQSGGTVLIDDKSRLLRHPTAGLLIDVEP